MKVHEENKIYALLYYMNFTEEEAEKIIDYIDNKDVGDDDLINLLMDLENWED